jgi:hypothetical protein
MELLFTLTHSNIAKPEHEMSGRFIKGRAISTPLPAISTFLIPPAGVHLLTSPYHGNYYGRTRRNYVIMRIIIKKCQVLKMKLFVTTLTLIHPNRLNQTLHLGYIP